MGKHQPSRKCIQLSWINLFDMIYMFIIFYTCLLFFIHVYYFYFNTKFIYNFFSYLKNLDYCFVFLLKLDLKKRCWTWTNKWTDISTYSTKIIIIGLLQNWFNSKISIQIFVNLDIIQLLNES